MRQTILPDILILGGCVICLVPLLVAKETGQLSSGQTVGLLFALAAVGMSLTLIIAARRTRRIRQQFVAVRRPLPDAEYLRQMGASGAYAEFCLILRMGFAIDCCVPPEMIHPEETIRELQQLCFDGFFLHEIGFALQLAFPGRATDIRLLKVFEGWKTITFRQCVEGAARELGILPAHQLHLQC